MQRPWPGKPRRSKRCPKTWIGACCLMLALLLTILCAPPWLAALIVAGLLCIVGVRLLFYP